MNTTKKLWLGIGLLLVLTPLGISVPKWFGAGGAWGEWGIEEIQKMTGFVPEGMKRLAGKWKAPLSDYAVFGQGQGPAREGLGYLAAGLIGIAVCAGIVYLLAKLLARGNKASDDNK
jgi:hypothetical protein